MTMYIALLRGINVGGHNIIKMAELRRVLEEIGLERVKTYIQSGNVLFESEEGAAALIKRIEEKILEEFGFPVPVVLRTAQEWERIIQNCPFITEGLAEGESVNVAFLAANPSQEGLDRLSFYKTEKDNFQIEGNNVYLDFRHSIRDSKLAANLSKLGVPATVRNWKTVLKLSSMVKEIK